MASLEKVNEWARKSCPKWNKHRFLRKYYRKKYRNEAKKYWQSYEHLKKIEIYLKWSRKTNTYPWPYRSYKFANWEEDDSPESYSLITDQSEFVVRHSTSYCAWKIFEATGTWPQRKSQTKKFDAKNWQQFLAEAGYTEIVDRPGITNYFVGINSNEGEHGLVVWAESNVNRKTHQIQVSTYINKKYHFYEVDYRNYTWVKIE